MSYFAQHDEKAAATIVRRTRTILRPLSPLLTDLEEVGSVIVFGGVLRDMHHMPPSRFFRDVDLVVDGNAEEIDAVCQRHEGRRNRFGGYRLRYRGRMLDIWPLSRTWAISNGYVEGCGVAALLKTTYFSTDSIAYDLSNGHLYTSPDYFELLRAQVVSLVLRENPHPAGALIRTLRLVYGGRARLDWALAHQTQTLLESHWNWLLGEAAMSLQAAGLKVNLESFRENIAAYLSAGLRDQPFSMFQQSDSWKACEKPTQATLRFFF